MHKDSMDVQNGLIELLSSHNQDVAELEEIRAFIDKRLDDTPYTTKVGFNIKDLAELYGHVKDYSAIHKLCSKLIHPTSIKVSAYKTLAENDNYLPVLEQVGVFFCQKIEELTHEIARSTSA